MTLEHGGDWTFSGPFIALIVFPLVALVANSIIIIASLLRGCTGKLLLRRIAAAILYVLSFFQLGLLAAAPLKKISSTVVIPRQVFIVIDTSGSMLLPLDAGEPRFSRADAAAVLALDLQRHLKKLDSRPVTIAASAADGLRLPDNPGVGIFPHADDQQSPSRLGDAFVDLAARAPDFGRSGLPAAAVFLSDGRVTGGTPLAQAAGKLRDAGLILHAVQLGSPVKSEDSDLVLDSLEAPWGCRTGDVVRFKAFVEFLAGKADSAADGVGHGGQIHARLLVRSGVPDSPPMVLPFNIEPGRRVPIEFEMDAPPLRWWKVSAEITTEARADRRQDNNRREVLVEVVRERARVVWVEGELSAGGAKRRKWTAAGDWETLFVDAWYKTGKKGKKILDEYSAAMADADAVCLVNADARDLLSGDNIERIFFSGRRPPGLLLIGPRSIVGVSSGTLSVRCPFSLSEVSSHMKGSPASHPDIATRADWSRPLFPILKGKGEIQLPAWEIHGLEIRERSAAYGLLIDSNGLLLAACFDSPAGRTATVASSAVFQAMAAAEQEKRGAKPNSVGGREQAGSLAAGDFLRRCVLWTAGRAGTDGNSLRIVPLRRSASAGEEIPVRIEAENEKSVENFSGKSLELDWRIRPEAKNNDSAAQIPGNDGGGSWEKMNFRWTTGAPPLMLRPSKGGTLDMELRLPDMKGKPLDSVHLRISGGNPEMLEPTANPVDMREAAQACGGKFFAPARQVDLRKCAADVADSIRERLEPLRLSSIKIVRPAWLKWLWLPALLMIFICWRLEGPRPWRYN